MAVEFPSGAGQALGDHLATCAPLRLSGDIWYVSSATGTDAASPAGKSELKPLATLKQALTNAADDDIIVLLDGHTETSTADADWTSSKRVAIVGAGRSGGLPTVKLTCGNVGALGGSLSLTGNGAQLRNIWVTARTATNAGARVLLSGANQSLIDCYFPCDQYDTGPAVSIAASTHCLLDGCTFISTAASTSAQPESAVKLTGAQTRMQITGCVFSGGTVGFSNPYAFDSGSNAITHLEGEAISLLLGADMKFASATTGWLNVQTSTGGARVDW